MAKCHKKAVFAYSSHLLICKQQVENLRNLGHIKKEDCNETSSPPLSYYVDTDLKFYFLLCAFTFICHSVEGSHNIRVLVLSFDIRKFIHWRRRDGFNRVAVVKVYAFTLSKSVNHILRSLVFPACTLRLFPEQNQSIAGPYGLQLLWLKRGWLRTAGFGSSRDGGVVSLCAL